jgi:hypothetical protein
MGPMLLLCRRRSRRCDTLSLNHWLVGLPPIAWVHTVSSQAGRCHSTSLWLAVTVGMGPWYRSRCCVYQVVLKLAEPGAQQAGTKMTKPSTLASLKGFLRSPPPVDDAADQRSPEPQVGVHIRPTVLCV